MSPSSFEQRVRMGNCYSVSTPKLNLVAAGNMRVTFQNPNGSGKNIYIYALMAANDSSSFAWGDLRLDPNAGLPADVATAINQNLSSSNQSVAVIKHDINLVTPLSGGSLMYSVPAPPSSDTTFRNELIVLPPNKMIGLNVAFLGLGRAMFRAYFWEE